MLCIHIGYIFVPAGDIVILECKINSDWGSGRCSTTTDSGIFPLNYTGILFKSVDKSQPTAGHTIANGIARGPDVAVQGKYPVMPPK